MASVVPAHRGGGSLKPNHLLEVLGLWREDAPFGFSTMFKTTYKLTASGFDNYLMPDSQAGPRREDASDANQLLTYYTDRLFTLGWLSTLTPGMYSIVQTKRVITTTSMLLLLMLLYAGGVCTKTHDDCADLFDEGSLANAKTIREDCRSAYGKENGVCFGHITAAQGLVVSALAAFLLGLFNGITINRWWSIRTSLGVIQKKINTLSGNIGAMVDGSRKADKEDLVRYLNLAHGMLYLRIASDEGGTLAPADIRRINNAYKVYDQLCSEYGPPSGVNPAFFQQVAGGKPKELVTEAEVDLLAREMMPHATVLAWATCSLATLNKYGKVGGGGFGPLFMLPLAAVKEAMEDVMLLINNQIPFCYTSLLALVIKCHEMFVAVYCGTLVGTGFQGNDFTNLFWGFVILIVNVWVFEGVFEIHSQLNNPCRSEPNDFPTQVFHLSTLYTSSALLASASGESGCPGGLSASAREMKEEKDEAEAKKLREKDMAKRRMRLLDADDDDDGVDAGEDEDEGADGGGDDGGGDDGG
eukprot:CAMPEP_0182888024 /NCGR_PEP_ID=MMETSP0034_2-20130328/21179_1 /TAXON_ID=156128 /ORGANISM="Nephroselmis pyriformis, Strain CCMP717" /LENGTH=527 /DNA_ID=CAMNT_0025021425 /DNA_START=52 /DNA_END=1632 /DNA_ORIENTATION=+